MFGAATGSARYAKVRQIKQFQQLEQISIYIA